MEGEGRGRGGDGCSFSADRTGIRFIPVTVGPKFTVAYIRTHMLHIRTDMLHQLLVESRWTEDSFQIPAVIRGVFDSMILAESTRKTFPGS